MKRTCTSALALAACVSAFAADLPARRPGLWESTLTLTPSRTPPLHMRICIDAATDRPLLDYTLGLDKAHCARIEIQGGAGRYAVDSKCSLGPGVTNTHSDIAFDGAAAYKVVSQIRHEGPSSGKPDTHAELQARWVGPCESGQRAGDAVIDPPGARLNLRAVLAKP